MMDIPIKTHLSKIVAFLKCQPRMPLAKQKIIMMEIKIVEIISEKLPIINNWGLYTNMKGTMYEAIPILAAIYPVFIGFDFATPAAANAARQTGGVILDVTPK